MVTFPRAGAVAPLFAVLVALMVTLALAVPVSGCDGDDPSEPSETVYPSQTTLGYQTPGESDASAGSQTTQTSRAGQTTVAPIVERFTRENWGVLAADPEAHRGALVDIVGRLLDAPVRRDDGSFWQMYADPRNYGWNTSVRYSDPSFAVDADDFVRVTGKVTGSLQGENIFGEEITLVEIFAESAEVVDVMAAASPADRTVPLAESIDQHGIVVTLEKIEFAADETRVFVEVVNESRDTASLYDLQLATAVQEGTLYEAERLWDYYPTLEGELPPGTDTAGIIVFQTLDGSQPLEIRMEAGSDDHTLSFEPYVFEVPAEQTPAE